MIGIWQRFHWNLELTVFELTLPNLYKAKKWNNKNCTVTSITFSECDEEIMRKNIFQRRCSNTNIGNRRPFYVDIAPKRFCTWSANSFEHRRSGDKKQKNDYAAI